MRIAVAASIVFVGLCAIGAFLAESSRKHTAPAPAPASAPATPITCLDIPCKWEVSDAGVSSTIVCPAGGYNWKKLETPIVGGVLISCICCK